MPEFDERAAEVVREDVERGLQKSFRSRSETGVEIIDASLTNGDATAVVWRFDCTHSGLFQGLKPRDKAVTIRGVTIVDHAAEGGPLLQRFVDWNEVMADLGMYANYRPTIETDEAGREALSD